MRVYNCKIKVLKTGYLPEAREDTRDIFVLADNIKQAVKKASTYRLTGDIHKTVEVIDATLHCEIDK